MFSDVAKSLRVCQEAIDAMPLVDALDHDERDALSFTVGTCKDRLTLLAGECLLPLRGGVPALLALDDPHERALASLRFALDRLDKARPLSLASRRTLAGVRFMAEAVLFALEAALPEDEAEVRYHPAGR